MPRLKRPDPLAKAIGGRVRALRLERGLTLEKLAYENAISKGTISDLERGLARPSVVTLEAIAEGLDGELLDLVRPDDDERHRVIELSRNASAKALRAASTALERGRRTS